MSIEAKKWQAFYAKTSAKQYPPVHEKIKLNFLTIFPRKNNIFEEKKFLTFSLFIFLLYFVTSHVDILSLFLFYSTYLCYKCS